MDSGHASFEDLDAETLLEHSAWLRGLARQLVLGSAQVDDLVQAAWTAALERPPRRGVPLRAWLAGIVRNQALVERRAGGRRAYREGQAARADRVPSTDELSARAEQQEQLLHELQGLPDMYREALLLRYYEDLKPAQIAEHLGVPVNTVYTRLARGLEQMRSRLDARSGGDRRAWSLALLPLARPEPASAALTSMSFTAALGAWIMTQPLKALALVAFLSTALGFWFTREAPIPDLRRAASPQQAASELFAPRVARSSSATEVSAGRERTALGLPPVDEAPSSAIAGRVLDLAGEPVAGARIRRRSAPRPGVRVIQGTVRGFAHAFSASDGSFSLRPSEQPEQGWVHALHGDYFALHEAVELRDDAESRVVMSPRVTTTLAVEVVDASSGREVPRYRLLASVPYEGSDATYTTLSRDVLTGPAELEVEFADGRPLNLLLEVLGLAPDADPSTYRREVWPVRDGRTPVRFVLDLDGPERAAGTRVAHGRVVDDVSGEPIGGVEIVVHPLTEDGIYGLQKRGVQTFADGRFRIAMGSAPQARVSAFHPGYEHAPATGRFDGENACELRLQRRAAIRGALHDADGQPLAGAPLLLHGPSSRERQRLATFERHEYQWRTTTDAEGRFEFEGLLAARYGLFVLRGPHEPDDDALARRTVRLEPGEQRELLLELDAPERVTVHGTVRAGAPVEEALVPVFLPYADDAYWVPGEARGDGYSAGGLERGRYLVVITPANDDFGGPLGMHLDVEVVGFGDQVLDFDLPHGAVHGRVLLSEQLTRPRVVVVPKLPPGFAHQFVRSSGVAQAFGASPDANGEFVIEGLGTGSYLLQLHGAGNGSSELVAEKEVFVSGITDLGAWQPALR